MQIMEGLPNQEVSSISLPAMENLAFIIDASEFVSMFCVCGYVLQRHMQRMEGPPHQEVSSTHVPAMENLAFIIDAREFVSMFRVCGYVLPYANNERPPNPLKSGKCLKTRRQFDDFYITNITHIPSLHRPSAHDDCRDDGDCVLRRRVKDASPGQFTLGNATEKFCHCNSLGWGPSRAEIQNKIRRQGFF